MPGSYDFFNNDVVRFVNSGQFKNILDVGPGAGKWGKLLRQEGRRIEACEIFAPYVEQYNLRALYDQVTVSDITKFSFTERQFDLVIMGDILEHLTVEAAQALLKDLASKNIPALVMVPYNYEQGASHGNEHEEHLQPDLTEELFHERYPGFKKIISNKYQGIFTTAPSAYLSFDDFCDQTIVFVTTYNRPKITQICLENLAATCEGVQLYVVDDCSTLSIDDLKKWAGPKAIVEKLEKNMGVEKLRLTKIQEILKQGKYRYIYHTDNDALHDAAWLPKLFMMRQEWLDKNPNATPIPNLCLFNSKLHEPRTVGMFGDYYVRRECPGISFFVDLENLRLHGDKLQALIDTKDLPTSWDFLVRALTGVPVLVTPTSYLEHYGADGIHNPNFTDRAQNPTPWLKSIEPKIYAAIAPLSERKLKQVPTVYGLNIESMGDVIAAVPAVRYAIKKYHQTTDYLVVAPKQFHCLLPFVPKEKLKALGETYTTTKEWDTRLIFHRPKNPTHTGVQREKLSMIQANSIALLSHDLPKNEQYFEPLPEVPVDHFNVDFSKSVLIVADYCSEGRALPRHILEGLVVYVKEKNLLPVLVGTRPSALTEELAQNGAIDLTGKTSIPELATIIRQSLCVVGPDGGTVNLAGTTSTPVVASYTLVDPELRKLPRPMGEHRVVTPDCSCRFCFTRSNSPREDRGCEFGDYACVHNLHLSKFIRHLEDVLPDDSELEAEDVA